MTRTLEQRFLAFRPSGDPGSLASIFDETAPQLARLAGHLCRDADEVEELVQATFVALLEGRDRYREDEPFLPFLLGILTHKWHHLVRERRRRPDPARLTAGNAPADPVAGAAYRELSGALQTELGRLPEPYAEVLRLHLVEGLDSKAIATRLGRNRGTVRAQLHRGLARLRTALPAGFAAGVSVVTVLGSGRLAAMRRQVLERAATLPGGAAAGVTAGWLAVHGKSLLAGAGAVLLVTLASLAVRSGDAPRTKPEATPHRAGTAEPQLAHGGTATPVQAAARTTVPAPQPAAGGAAVQFTGRCVDAVTGRPLAGVDVALQAWPVDRENSYRFAVGTLRLPAAEASDAEGRFLVEGRIPTGARYAVSLACRRDDRVDRAGMWWADELGALTALGDIPMRAGVRVRGRVVDPEGRGVAGARVRILDLERGQALRPFGDGSSGTTATTDGDGGFELGSAVPDGAQTVAVHAAGYRLPRPETVFLVPGRAATLELRLTPLPTITGRVTTAGGAPVAGLRVTAVLPRTRATAGLGVSDREGHFVVRQQRGLDDTTAPVELRFDSDGSFLPPAARPGVRWGDGDIHVDATPARTAALVVVDAATGSPVEDYGVVCTPLVPDRGREVPAGDTDLRHDGAHPGGRLVLDRVWPGPNRLLVIPRSPLLRPSDDLRFEVGATPTQLRVELVRARLVTVQVVGAHGTPIAGSQVEAVEVDEEETEPRVDIAWTELFDRGTSGPDGRVRLHVPPSRRAITLQVRGRGHVATLAKDRPIPDAGDLRVEVRQGARLRGTLQPRTLAGPGVGLVLQDTGDAWRRFPRQERGVLRVAADGTFDLQHLPPGSWNLHLQIGDDLREPPLGRIELRDGGVSAIGLDASAFAPASLTGRVLLDGRVPAGAAGVSLYPATDTGTWIRHGALQADGGFTVSNLPAGRYRLAVRVVGGETYRAFLAPDLVAVEAGAAVDRTFDLTRRRAVVRLRDSAGAPLSGGHATLRSTTCAFRWSLPADERGELVLDPAPPMACEVWVASTRIGTWEPRGDGAAPLELRATEGARRR